LLVPPGDRNLRGEDGGAGLIAFLADFPEGETRLPWRTEKALDLEANMN
jgi:hypothetical protein